MGRPTRRLLTREQIAVAALDLLDEQGPAGLGMRPLAARMGVSAPSLYHHVTGQDDVIELVLDLVDAQIDVSALDEPDWRLGVERFAHSYRNCFLAHPDVLTLVARRQLTAPNALRVYDRLAATLGRAGLPREHTMQVMATLDAIVLGSVFDDFIAGFAPDIEQYESDFPHLAAALAVTNRTAVNDTAFDNALTILLDELDRRLAAGKQPHNQPG